MAAKKKTPTLAQVRRLAREKLGHESAVHIDADPFSPSTYHGRITNFTSRVTDVYEASRSAALRALHAALEAL